MQSNPPFPASESPALLRASHLGMCFGVRDALALAQSRAASAPLTVLGDLVHNDIVLRRLREQGVRFAADLPSVTTPDVMITAHGASDARIQSIRERGHHVIEATCPLVRHAHRALRRLVEEGFHPVVIGQRGHVEVRGLTEDFPGCDIVLTREDIAALAPHGRFGVVSQTTQPADRVRVLVEALREQFPTSEVRFVDTVCQPTRQRQQAAVELARQCDVVIVIGGAHSNNTRELAATCARHGARVHSVQHADELRGDWLHGARAIGITAGTSTPDDLVDAVEARLRELSQQAVAPTA